MDVVSTTKERFLLSVCFMHGHTIFIFTCTFNIQYCRYKKRNTLGQAISYINLLLMTMHTLLEKIFSQKLIQTKKKRKKRK